MEKAILKGLASLAAVAALWCTSLGTAVAGTNSWTKILSLGDSEYATLVAVDPSNVSTIFMVVEVRGSLPFSTRILKTTDGGATWNPVFSDTHQVTSIVVDPLTPSTLYAATSGLINFGGALYKSTDGGATWNVRNIGLTAEVIGLAIDPLVSSVVFARTRDPVGIFRTVDGGNLWTSVSNAPAGPIVSDPVNSANVYAGTTNGILKSTDRGATWTEVQLFVPGGGAAGFNMIIDALAIDPAAPANLFAASFLPDGVYRSTDGGNTWSTVIGMMLEGAGSRPVDSLVLVPGVPRALFALTSNTATCDIFRSLDDGQSWTFAHAGLPVFNAQSTPPCYGTLFDLTHSPAAPNVLFASVFGAISGQGAGVFRFTHDASLLTPMCSLSVTPARVAEGGTATLSTYCSPPATSFAWNPNTGLSSSDSGGTVLPTRTTTYTVQGSNANGPGNQASVTVYAPSPRLANISTRGEVLTGNDVMIGGFVIGGPSAKTVVVRARGPTLVPYGITNALANPTLRLVRSSDQATLAINDDWQSASNAADIAASGFAPSDALESAVLMTLAPGAYTAIVSGVGGGRGVGIVEVFEVDHPEVPLVNISTRGQVLTGDEVMIGGFVIQGNEPLTVVVRARGPTLVPYGITNALADPVLQLYSGQTQIAQNDDWSTAANAAQVQSSGFAPSNSKESAILITLDPGAYTAIVRGAGGTTGVGIVEVFAQ
jgi:photosystem II stability/assembly factor-like uncharacterized protein